MSMLGQSHLPSCTNSSQLSRLLDFCSIGCTISHRIRWVKSRAGHRQWKKWATTDNQQPTPDTHHCQQLETNNNHRQQHPTFNPRRSTTDFQQPTKNNYNRQIHPANRKNNRQQIGVKQNMRKCANFWRIFAKIVQILPFKLTFSWK
jgi:hypothetical protein